MHFISQKAPGCHSFGTDDFASFLNDCKEYDVVILKNIREGLYPKYPIYDVIVLNEKLIKNKKKIDLGSSLYIKEYSTKRIDLSKYIHENEQDGLAEILEYPGYSIKIILDPENSVCKTILHINGRGTGSYINIKLESTVYKLTDDPYLGEVLNPISGETCISIESDKDIDISSFDFNPGQLQVVFFTKD